jgi:hypothetical protein
MSSVSTSRHTSTSCCQSRLLRAKRETSRAATAPTRPRDTSATIKARSHDTAGSRTTQVLMDYFNLRPAQLPEALFHGVLQSTTFLMCATWCKEDRRIYSTALRCWWPAVIFSFIASSFGPTGQQRLRRWAGQQLAHQLDDSLTDLRRQFLPSGSMGNRIE